MEVLNELGLRWAELVTILGSWSIVKIQYMELCKQEGDACLYQPEW